jgi:CheY-like chemotaxis protein
MTELAGKHVLLVDDEPLVRFLVEDMLLRLGCVHVRQAADIAGTIAVLEETTPDLVVLDVFLDGVPAYPVAERLAAIGVPFFFMTGFGRKSLTDRWADRIVLAKPFSVEALADAVRALA